MNRVTYAGFEVLWKNERLDLSLEDLVLKSEYKTIFSDEERMLCKEEEKYNGTNSR